MTGEYGLIFAALSFAGDKQMCVSVAPVSLPCGLLLLPANADDSVSALVEPTDSFGDLIMWLPTKDGMGATETCTADT